MVPQKKLFHQHIFKNYFSQIQFIFPGACDDLAEERKNWEMALVKARTTHTNMGTLQLSVQAAVKYPAKNTTHQQVIGILKQYDTTLQTKVQDYLQIFTQHTIPNLGEPTTTDHLRKELVQDLWGLFLLQRYSRMRCDRERSHFILASPGWGYPPLRTASMQMRCAASYGYTNN